MTEIAVGTVVEFKSGGPTMTVVDISEDETNAVCKWYDLIRWRSESFPIAALRAVPEPAETPGPGLSSTRSR